jgi:hypothetical protein
MAVTSSDAKGVARYLDGRCGSTPSPSVFCSLPSGQAPVSTAPNETEPARTFMSV